MAFQEPKNLSEFQTLISGNDIVVVDFHASWCGPCKLIAPKLKKLAEATPSVTFSKVDVDEVPDVAAEQQIRAMPTIQFFKNGVKVGEVVGANFAKIESTLKEITA